MNAARATRRFTAEEVLRMVETGILREDEKVELIDGELVAVCPQGPRHRALTAIVHACLEHVFRPGFHVQDHSPIDAGPHSMPEPDVAVVRGSARDLLDRHPAAADLALVVEISVTSHAEDRAKAETYARARVAEYWQLDVPARKLIVRTDPADGEYRTTRIVPDGERVPVHGTTIPVADLLP